MMVKASMVEESDVFFIFYFCLDESTGDVPANFLDEKLPRLAEKMSKRFMVIQRELRVLRKCGQYQDLMLLSEGDNEAWSYTDQSYYKEMARPFGEPLFTEDEDVIYIKGEKYDYTLVSMETRAWC